MRKAILGFVLLILSGSENYASAEVKELFNYRFLWPKIEASPGENLAELKINSSQCASSLSTPLGKAKLDCYDLINADEEIVAQARILSLPDRDDVLVIMTELKKPISSGTGKYTNPHFALPAIQPAPALNYVLNFKIEEFSTPVHRPFPTTGPIVLYNRNLEVLIISPLDNFMSAMQAPVNGEWWCGFGGMIEQIPAGTISQTILVSGKGINQTFMKWGELIQKWHHHKPTEPYADIAMSYLGYWTDNGSYYYYRTESGMNYHQTLLGVKAYADKDGIPYRYFQIDSWWYPKAEIKLRSSHNRGGFLLWEPNPEMFPQGLSAFQKELGLPLVAHNRYCSDKSPYCQKYQCVYHQGDKRKGAYPISPGFWEEIMNNAVKFGVLVYEQDWLYTHLDMIPWLRSGLGNAESWYDNMANSAEKRGLTMQLCMASPEFFMQNLKHANETHIRTSHDYKGGLPKRFFWMPFHKVGLFAYAVGLWPFKDNFQTTAGQRPTYNILSEANPMEEALVASLSGGPIGPSDKIGKSDPGLIMRTCRKDGLLLKPDRPATPIDIMFIYNQHFTGGKRPWIVSTESNHEIGSTVYLASFNLWPETTYEWFVTFSEIGISGKHLVYNYQTGEYKISSERINFGFMRPEKAFYYILCPLLENGMAIIGETEKFITLSKKRFPLIKLEQGVLRMKVEGVPKEEVKISIYFTTPPNQIIGKDLVYLPSELKPGINSFHLLIPDSGFSELMIK